MTIFAVRMNSSLRVRFCYQCFCVWVCVGRDVLYVPSVNCRMWYRERKRAQNRITLKRATPQNGIANATVNCKCEWDEFICDAVSWWLACRLKLFPISTTLTHHRKVQNLNSYHFFDWLSRGINIEFCTVVKLAEVKRGEKKRDANQSAVNRPCQNDNIGAHFVGPILDWLGLVWFGLNKTVCHAVRMFWNSVYLCAVFHYAWSSCSCSKTQVFIKCSGYAMSFLSSLRCCVLFVYIVVFDLWNTDRPQIIATYKYTQPTASAS